MLEQLAELDEAEEAGFDDNFADTAHATAEVGEVRALEGNLRETLEQIERALAKLDEGTYGICEDCGEPIGDARLEALPMTRWCISCAPRHS